MTEHRTWYSKLVSIDLTEKTHLPPHIDVSLYFSFLNRLNVRCQRQRGVTFFPVKHVLHAEGADFWQVVPEVTRLMSTLVVKVSN